MCNKTQVIGNQKILMISKNKALQWKTLLDLTTTNIDNVNCIK